MGNSSYGKTITNKHRRRNVKIVDATKGSELINEALFRIWIPYPKFATKLI